MASTATYVADEDGRYRYPGLGDAKPPGGANVHLLTQGGVCVRGTWNDSGSFIGWAPLPKRDHAREAELQQRGFKLP